MVAKARFSIYLTVNEASEVQQALTTVRDQYLAMSQMSQATEDEVQTLREKVATLSNVLMQF